MVGLVVETLEYVLVQVAVNSNRENTVSQSM